MTPCTHAASPVIVLSFPTCLVPEPSKRIPRMVELNRKAGMSEADVAKVRETRSMSCNTIVYQGFSMVDTRENCL